MIDHDRFCEIPFDKMDDDRTALKCVKEFFNLFRATQGWLEIFNLKAVRRLEVVNVCDKNADRKLGEANGDHQA